MEDHQLQQENPQSQQCPVSEAEDYDMDDDFKFLLSATEQNTHWQSEPIASICANDSTEELVVGIETGSVWFGGIRRGCRCNGGMVFYCRG